MPRSLNFSLILARNFKLIFREHLFLTSQANGYVVVMLYAAQVARVLQSIGEVVVAQAI